MIVAAKPENEQQRIASLYEYNLLDTMSEADYDNITRIASEICQVPMSLISLIDRDRQFLKSTVGLDATETPRDVAFCSHTILTLKRYLRFLIRLMMSVFMIIPMKQVTPT